MMSATRPRGQAADVTRTASGHVAPSRDAQATRRPFPSLPSPVPIPFSKTGLAIGLFGSEFSETGQ